MARRTFPSEGSRLAYGISGPYLAHRVASSVVLYADQALTTLADVRVKNADGSVGTAYTGSAVPVDSASQLPDFYGPDDSTDTLYFAESGGTGVIHSSEDDRLDTLEAAVDESTARALGWEFVTDHGADPTGVADSTAAFAAAYTAAGAGGTVYAPAGSYDVSAWPAAVTGQRFVGAGLRATTITHTGSGILSDQNANYLGFENFRILAGADSTGLLRFRDSSFMRVVRVELDGTGATSNLAIGLWLRDKNNNGTGGCYYGLFEGVYAHGCKWGGYFESQPMSTPLINSHTLLNCNFSDNRNDGVYVSYCQGLVFLGGAIERNGKAATAPEASRGYGLNLASAPGLRVYGTWLEGNKIGTVNVQASAGNQNLHIEPAAMSQYAADGGPSSGLVGAANVGPQSYIRPVYGSGGNSDCIDTRLSDSVVTATGAVTAKFRDIVLANANSGAFTVTLPSSQKGARVTVKKTDASANAVTVSPASGTIDGAASLVIAVQYAAYTLVCSGTDWFVT